MGVRYELYEFCMAMLKADGCLKAAYDAEVDAGRHVYGTVALTEVNGPVLTVRYKLHDNCLVEQEQQPQQQPTLQHQSSGMMSEGTGLPKENKAKTVSQPVPELNELRHGVLFTFMQQGGSNSFGNKNQAGEALVPKGHLLTSRKSSCSHMVRLVPLSK